MVNISITSAWMAANPQYSPNTFCIQIGEPGYKYFATSNQVNTNDRTSAVTNGGPAFVVLRMNESFDLGNEEFENLVYSSKNGGATNFITQLLYLVRKGAVQVQQDSGTPMTPSQIMAYTAP
jgi:hypothetical protein